VPQGQHTIEFKYSPASFKAGALLAIIALLGFLGWWAYERWRWRNVTAAPLPPDAGPEA